jgi:type VII secretion-associated serine protease mycosin
MTPPGRFGRLAVSAVAVSVVAAAVVAAATVAAVVAGVAGPLTAAALPAAATLAPAPAATSAPAPAAAPIPCRNPPKGGEELPASAPRDPMIVRLGLERAWELSTGAGVTVAVVDSGVDAGQPKIQPALVPGFDLVTTQAPPGWQRVPGGVGDCGASHGTPVAGLIAARPGRDDRMVGVAYDAKIAPVRFVDGIDQASDAMIAKAIRTGADLGQVLNLSFALPVDRPLIRQAVRYALNRNVVVVAAAGNESSTPGQAWYPAAYPGVLAVAGLKLDGTPLQESNRGPWVGIAAPGEGLTAPAAVRGYVGLKGTSFATALVSGVAALVRSRFPSMPAAQVVRRLTATAVPLGVARDDRVGAGIVDPFAALTAQTVGTGATPTPAGSGAVRVQPIPARPAGVSDRWGRVLAVAGALALAALLAYLARIAVRSAIRRRWRPGGGAQPEGSHVPVPELPDVRLT